jgi:NitT/TauT family transport system substrate-binding protein
MALIQTRRRFVGGLAAAAAAGLVRAPRALAAEGALETTTVRLFRNPAICMAPAYVAELLRAEGFTDIRYADVSAVAQSVALGRGEVDFSGGFALNHVKAIDAGAPIVVLGGVHVGCYELLARESIRGISELKGKSVGLKASPPDLLTLMAAHVGLDPAKDISWVTPDADPSVNPLDLFAEGKIDAFLGFPPEPQELRARHAGHLIVSTTLDRPWSQYFCCMVAGNQDYVRKYPNATKRVLRAILKGADLCVTDPARVARSIVDGGFTPRYDYALQTLTEVPYDRWRDYDPEDTMRFYALRLREVGLIKSSPQKIIAEGTDWRLFDELKRELKA